MDDLIFETKYWKIVLAEDQYYLGRCYIILKRKCGDLADLSEKEILDFLELVKKLEKAIKKSFNATMFSWGCLMNNAYRNKYPKPQVHWHFRPRYIDKVEFGGLVFEDKEFGEHYTRKTDRKLSDEIRKKIIEKIREKA
ncbi:MAG: HIT family protein [Candidatus Pacearchaeota archaeon]|nr:HIT family protein [Candidatus Pacearchaeota archaeon]